MTDDDYDDVPWASPEIRLAYEAALGKFILNFNEVDNRLTEIIELLLTRLKRSDLTNACTKRDYAHKCLVLDLLKSSSEGRGIRDVSVDLLKMLGRERNKLAHGHFDQNPFDGTYDVVTKHVRAQYSAEMLGELSAKADKAIEALRYADAFYQFTDEPGL